MSRFPSFVAGLEMICMDEHTIFPKINDCLIAEDSDLLKISLYLLKCELVYERNKVLFDDILVTDLGNAVRFMFHQGHVCLQHRGHKYYHVPLPLGENAIWLAQMALSISQLPK